MAIDAFPQYASRTIYACGYVKWNIDIKGIIQHACNYWPNLNMNILRIPKIGFTMEAGCIGPSCNVGCDCHRLRLCYGGLSVGCSSSQLYSVASAASSGFISRYNNLGLGNSVATVSLTQDSDASLFYGVLNGQFDVGLVDRPPSIDEWGSMPNLQLWAVGYSGNLPLKGQNLDPMNLLWIITDSNLIRNVGADSAMSVFASYIRNNINDCLTGSGFAALSLADNSGGLDVDSTNNTYAPLPGQTQRIPNGIADGTDFIYFCSAYIKYYAGSGTLNPLADINVDGKVDGIDFIKFVAAYILYYNPTYSLTKTINQRSLTDDLSAPSGVVSAVEGGSNNTVWSVRS